MSFLTTGLAFRKRHPVQPAARLHSDCMAVYRSDERFIAVDELQPLTRLQTVYSSRHTSYDTNYAANVSEVEIFYPQTMSYWDGI